MASKNVRRLGGLLALLALIGGAVALALAMRGGDGGAPSAGASALAASAAGSAPAKPALSVTAAAASLADWPRTLSANGSIAAWQESVVSAEQGGLRLTEVRVNVGDAVRRGQVLALIATDTLQVELAQVRASLAEAEATLADAEANAARARQLQTTGAISAQQIHQYLTVEQTARARVAAQRAAIRAAELRLSKTRIVAPDDGVISARLATVGAVATPGQELFRLIRGGRLEWRAEVAAADLSRLKPGMAAALTTPDHQAVRGTVRMVAPTVDPQTRNGLVYVDLPRDGAARAGMFARGEFEVGRAQALTLPQSAVLLRDGFNYAFRLGDDGRVTQVKVAVGRRVGDRVEILSGLGPGEKVVESGGGFLADGDLVRVVQPAGPVAAR